MGAEQTQVAEASRGTGLCSQVRGKGLLIIHGCEIFLAPGWRQQTHCSCRSQTGKRSGNSPAKCFAHVAAGAIANLGLARGIQGDAAEAIVEVMNEDQPACEVLRALHRVVMFAS